MLTFVKRVETYTYSGLFGVDFEIRLFPVEGEFEIQFLNTLHTGRYDPFAANPVREVVLKLLGNLQDEIAKTTETVRKWPDCEHDVVYQRSKKLSEMEGCG